MGVPTLPPYVEPTGPVVTTLDPVVYGSADGEGSGSVYISLSDRARYIPGRSDGSELDDEDSRSPAPPNSRA